MPVTSAQELHDLVQTLSDQFVRTHEPAANKLWNEADAHLEHALHEGGSWIVQEIGHLHEEWQQHRVNLQQVEAWFAHHGQLLARVAEDPLKLAGEAFTVGGLGVALAGEHVGIPAAIAQGLERAERLGSKVGGFSKDWGWAIAPVLSFIPKVGTAFEVDTFARLGQNLARHHYQDAYEEGSELTASKLAEEAGEAKNPEAAAAMALASTDVTIYEHVEMAYRKIDWSYTASHLSQLNPFASGAAQAVWQSEVAGFESLGKDMVGNVGSFVGGLFHKATS